MKDTVVVVTYDEFGGQWDHVSPPGQGLYDQWGRGTRVPTLVDVTPWPWPSHCESHGRLKGRGVTHEGEGAFAGADRTEAA